MKFIVDSLPLYEQDCPFSNICQCEDNKMYDNNSECPRHWYSDKVCEEHPTECYLLIEKEAYEKENEE